MSCIRWAPSVVKAPATTNGEVNGTVVKKDDPGGAKESIRCVIATGSVDLSVRVFAA